jgi:hypothetical protein
LSIVCPRPCRSHITLAPRERYDRPVGHSSPVLTGAEWDELGTVKAASVRVVSRREEITSVRQAAAVCNVTPPVVRRWLSLGLITEPPWTVRQLHQIRDETDPQGRRRGPQVPHGTLTRWLEGCGLRRMP